MNNSSSAPVSFIPKFLVSGARILGFLTSALSLGTATIAVAADFSGPSQTSPQLSPAALQLCNNLKSVYAQNTKPSWARAGAPILPLNFWVTDNSRIKLGTHFSRLSFACAEQGVEMVHEAHLVYGRDDATTGKEVIESKIILQKDVFKIQADGTVIDEIYYENSQGILEKSEFTLLLAEIANEKLTFTATLPFPAPVCPLSSGLDNFDHCELRIEHTAEFKDGDVSGYDGYSIVALSKEGTVLRSVDVPKSLSLSGDKARIFALAP